MKLLGMGKINIMKEGKITTQIDYNKTATNNKQQQTTNGTLTDTVQKDPPLSYKEETTEHNLMAP